MVTLEIVAEGVALWRAVSGVPLSIFLVDFLAGFCRAFVLLDFTGFNFLAFLRTLFLLEADAGRNLFAFSIGVPATCEASAVKGLSRASSELKTLEQSDTADS